MADLVSDGQQDTSIDLGRLSLGVATAYDYTYEHLATAYDYTYEHLATGYEYTSQHGAFRSNLTTDGKVSGVLEKQVCVCLPVCLLVCVKDL